MENFIFCAVSLSENRLRVSSITNMIVSIKTSPFSIPPKEFCLPNYANIKRQINQREFGTFNVNLSRANKWSV